MLAQSALASTLADPEVDLAVVPHGAAGLRALPQDAALPGAGQRDRVRADLQGAGIQTSVHYPPIHAFSYYASPDGRPLPQTDEVAPRLLTLPPYGGLEDDQVEAVISGLLAAVERG